jgi:hypothetical protein
MVRYVVRLPYRDDAAFIYLATDSTWAEQYKLGTFSA